MSFLINPYQFASAAVPWTPAQLTTALWLDAADTATITQVSNAVSVWADKSGGGYDFEQTSPTLRPLYNTVTLNGISVPDFDGSNDYMTAGNVLNDVWTGAGFELTWVARSDSVTDSNGQILTKVASGPDNVRQFSCSLRTSRIQLGTFYTPDTANYTVVNGSTVATSGQWVMATQAYTDTGTGSANTTARVQMTYDGSDETEVVLSSSGTLSTIDATAATLSIGAITGSGGLNLNNLNGAIAEIVVFPSTLSADDRQRLQGYYAHRWGLTANLPAGHPYKSTPPYV